MGNICNTINANKSKDSSDSSSDELNSTNLKFSDYINLEGEMKDYCGISYHIEQGSRDYQEDRASIFKLDDNREVYAVFDGHAGNHVVIKACKYIPLACKRYIHANSNTQLVLQNIFQKFGKSVRNMNSGSTVVVCILDRENMMVDVGNVGDSFCLLIDIYDRKVIRLTKNHNPVKGRVLSSKSHYGGLSLTQSFGDRLYPITYDGSYLTCGLINTTHIVVASDGVSHKLSDDEIMETIIKSVKKNNIAKKLVRRAIDNFQFTDNTTAIVIDLTKIDNSKTKMNELSSKSDEFSPKSSESNSKSNEDSSESNETNSESEESSLYD